MSDSSDSSNKEQERIALLGDSEWDGGNNSDGPFFDSAASAGREIERSPRDQLDDNVQDMIRAVDDLLLNMMERDDADVAAATATATAAADATASATAKGKATAARTAASGTSTTNGNHHPNRSSSTTTATTALGDVTVGANVPAATVDATAGASPSSKPQRTAATTKLQLRHRLEKASQKLKRSLDLKGKVVQPVARASLEASRRIITGSHATRIRDYVALPKVVKVLDKYTFTAGVMGMLLTEYIILQYSELFRYYNLLTMLPLLMLRVVLFRRTKQQYFLLDYCYWVNGLGFLLTLLPPLLQNFLLPGLQSLQSTVPLLATTLAHALQLIQHTSTQQTFWQIFFVSANGPLFFAMIAWNNSLVFHSVDKVTSTYVHLFPALLSWCERWHSPTSPLYRSHRRLGWTHHLGCPLAFYAAWQVVYLVQTEWWHKPVLDADPDLSTSLRYISSAEKMAINRATLRWCRALGWMGPEETFHPPTVKVKTIFVAFQMIMTAGTFLPAGIFYASYAVHTAVIIGVLTFSVYNGARYYIQVFSKIYDKRYDDGVVEDFVDTSAVMSEHKPRGDDDLGTKAIHVDSSSSSRDDKKQV